MANDGKFLNLTGGLAQQELAITVSTGAPDAGKLFKLDGTGRIDPSVLPVGLGAETLAVVASEALTAGDAVNIYNNAGTLNVRKADGSAAGKPADGFVLANFASAATATVYPEEAVVTGLSGLTPGTDIFLSVVTAGLITTTVPTGAAKVAQLLGKTLSATSVLFRRNAPVLMA